MKLNVKVFKTNELATTQLVCSGFRSNHANDLFMNQVAQIMAEHFSRSQGMFEIIIYDNTILKNDSTDESFNTYKTVSMFIRDHLLQRGVHPEAMKFGYLEWTFPKERKHKDTDVKMAIHIKIYNHRVMRVGVVDRMEIKDGVCVRDKYPTLASMGSDLAQKAQALLISATMCESSLEVRELKDDAFKIVQAIALIEHATDLIQGLQYNDPEEEKEEETAE